MPPQIRLEKVQRERRTVLALHALYKRELPSGRAGSGLYKVSNSSLAQRAQGGAARVDLHTKNHKITETEE
jgi:hypothetical protein